VPYSASLMEEAQAQRGGASTSAGVKKKTNVTPRKRKSNLDDLREL
jgi:hypothetical protein